MIGCFGKIPASADFVSLHGAMDEVCEFDAWLQASLAKQQNRDDWRELFDQVPVSFFCYHSRTGHWLIGGLISSRDSSNRRYPFMIFQTVKADPANPLISPYTLSELFSRQIKPLLYEASQGIDTSSLFERIKALRPLQDQDLKLYQRVHEKFLKDFSLREIAGSLQGSYPEFISNAVLHRLYGLSESLRNSPSLAVGLPLPAERGTKRPVADLWITWLARICAGNRLPEVSFLVDDFMRPSLICFPSRNSTNAYRVLTGTAAREERYELLEPFETFNEHPKTRVLPDDSLALSDFIDRFVDAMDLRSA